MENDEQGTGESQTRRQLRGGGGRGAAGREALRVSKQSRFRNAGKAGFRAIPEAGEGEEGRGRGTQANLELPAKGGGKGLTEGVQSVGMGTHKALPS